MTTVNKIVFKYYTVVVMPFVDSSSRPSFMGRLLSSKNEIEKL